MSNPIIANNTPIAVNLEKGKTYYFCKCGRSKNQPFCDGAHADTDITPHAFTADKDGEAWLCACKQSDNQPFCDGTHSQFGDDMIGKEAP